MDIERHLMSKRLENLLEKRSQLDAQIKAAQARKRVQARKEATRRKIIAGAIALENMDMHPDSAFAQELSALLDKHVTKPKDRELMGLPPTVATPFARVG